MVGNPRLNTRLLQRLLPAGQWETLQHLDYTGYFVFRGTITRDYQVLINRTIERFPANASDADARTLANRVRLEAPWVGSRIPNQCEVIVVIYRDLIDGSLALVFGRQIQLPANSAAGEGTVYVETLRLQDE